MGVDQNFWQGVKPPFRLPFLCIKTPQLRIPICIQDRNVDLCSLWKWYFMDVLTVDAFDGRSKGKNNILTNAARVMRHVVLGEGL